MVGFDPDKARQVFGSPAGWEAIAALAIGYAGDPASLPPPLRDREMAPRTRKPIAEFVLAGHSGHTAPFATKYLEIPPPPTHAPPPPLPPPSYFPFVPR